MPDATHARSVTTGTQQGRRCAPSRAKPHTFAQSNAVTPRFLRNTSRPSITYTLHLTIHHATTLAYKALMHSASLCTRGGRGQMPASTICLCVALHSQCGSASGKTSARERPQHSQNAVWAPTHCHTRPPANKHAQRQHTKGGWRGKRSSCKRALSRDATQTHQEGERAIPALADNQRRPRPLTLTLPQRPEGQPPPPPGTPCACMHPHHAHCPGSHCPAPTFSGTLCSIPPDCAQPDAAREALPAVGVRACEIEACGSALGWRCAAGKCVSCE
jgi:hypothetical protein